MLYYICALHTWWFLVVYGTMAIYPTHNSNNTVVAVKFALLFILITFLYEVRLVRPPRSLTYFSSVKDDL